ncbi:MAG: type II secretion system F family protein [Clostridiaceae bacterium]
MEVEEEDEMKKPFSERALLPIYNSIAGFLDRFTPKNIAENYQEILLQAGLADRFTPVRILINQILLGLIVLLLMVSFFRFSGMQINWLILVLVTIIALILPLSYFRGKAQTRQKLIKNSLPDILDMLYISVEAGLSFDAAMKKTASKMKGPLSEEITRAMDDITKGREREEALRSIGIRTQVEDVSSFITAVIQSELLGANIANMLRIQSRVMREKRRQRAEEAAAKMPLKMLFPMIFLLFPALFIVILGPALISIFNTFLGM